MIFVSSTIRTSAQYEWGRRYLVGVDDFRVVVGGRGRRRSSTDLRLQVMIDVMSPRAGRLFVPVRQQGFHQTAEPVAGQIVVTLTVIGQDFQRGDILLWKTKRMK